MIIYYVHKLTFFCIIVMHFPQKNCGKKWVILIEGLCFPIEQHLDCFRIKFQKYITYSLKQSAGKYISFGANKTLGFEWLTSPLSTTQGYAYLLKTLLLLPYYYKTLESFCSHTCAGLVVLLVIKIQSVLGLPQLYLIWLVKTRFKSVAYYQRYAKKCQSHFFASLFNLF